MTTTVSHVDLSTIVEHYADDFPMFQVLDETGAVVDKTALEGLDDDFLVQLMHDLVWARAFDVRITMLNRQGTLGNYAPGAGQEASQFASLAALEKGDFLVPTYRDLAPLIRHGLPMHQAFLWWRGHVAGNVYADDLAAWVPQVIVGGSIPHAAGAAFGFKRKGEQKVVMAYCGDGATSQGDFYEGLNFAGVYKAPLITVVQNNQWAISTPIEKQTKAQTLAQKAVAVGIPGVLVDGNDPIAMYLAVRQAREFALAGNGPVLIEARTWRGGPHTMSDDPRRYRDDALGESWAKRGPVERLGKYLADKGLWSVERDDEIAEEVKAQVKAALAEMGKVPAQTVSQLLSNMFEVAPQNIAEQIAQYQAKEAN